MSWAVVVRKFLGKADKAREQAKGKVVTKILPRIGLGQGRSAILSINFFLEFSFNHHIYTHINCGNILLPSHLISSLI